MKVKVEELISTLLVKSMTENGKCYEGRLWTRFRGVYSARRGLEEVLMVEKMYRGEKSVILMDGRPGM